jgi:iron complex outermembrane recepter protein
VYHDTFVRYQFGPSQGRRPARLIRGLELQVGVKDVFNTKPPLDTARATYASPYADIKLATYYVSFTKQL